MRRWVSIHGQKGAPELSVRIGRHLIGLRFGYPPRPLYTERHQGEFDIPKRFYYLLPGKRLTLTLRSREVPLDPTTLRRRW